MAEQALTSLVHECLLAQGVLYRQLGASLAYPTAERLLAWKNGSAIEAMAQAVSALGVPELEGALELLEQSLSEPSDLSWAEEYTFLLQRQAVASPYEGSYLVQSFFMQPQMLADVGAFYSAFGFQVAGDLADHVGAELEFLAVLCLKEAYAHEQGWAERVEICAQARRRFLAEHIGRWLPAFVMRVRDNARLPFFVALADLAGALVAHDCAAMGVVPERTGVFMPERTDARGEEDDVGCPA